MKVRPVVLYLFLKIEEVYVIFSKENFFKYVSISPFYLLVVGISAVPTFYALYLSLTDRKLFSEQWNFVGLQNIVAVFKDPEFWFALQNNFVYTFFVILFTIFLGLSISLALLRPFKGNYIARGVIIFPYLVPTIVAVMTFKWMFNDMYGIVNAILIDLGIVNHSVVWFGLDTAMPMVILISVWRFLPFAILLFLPALHAIPKDLYDAAKIDGASAFQQFSHITLPHLEEVILVVALLRGLWVFNNFNLIWLTTKGGPLHKTVQIPILSYKRAFLQYDLSQGCATSVSGFLFLLIPIIFYLTRVSE